MILEKILQVGRICLPVFAFLIIGFILRRYSLVKEKFLAAANKLLVNIILPLLIFGAIVKQQFRDILDLPVIISTIGTVALVLALHLVLRKFIAMNAADQGPFVAAAFWANITYFGFPLAENAFGAAGLGKAAVVNSFTLPVYLVLAIPFIARAGGAKQVNIKKRLISIISNPIIIGCLSGVSGSFLLDFFNIRDLSVEAQSLKAAGTWLVRGHYYLGKIGFPLALISAGAFLKLSAIKKDRLAVTAAAMTKLIISPLLTFLILVLFFPGISVAARGTAVLMMAMPNAVAFAVITGTVNPEAELPAAVLVVTTLLSILTVPLVLYFLVI